MKARSAAPSRWRDRTTHAAKRKGTMPGLRNHGGLPEFRDGNPRGGHSPKKKKSGMKSLNHSQRFGPSGSIAPSTERNHLLPSVYKNVTTLGFATNGRSVFVLFRFEKPSYAGAKNRTHSCFLDRSGILRTGDGAPVAEGMPPNKRMVG